MESNEDTRNVWSRTTECSLASAALEVKELLSRNGIDHEEQNRLQYLPKVRRQDPLWKTIEIQKESLLLTSVGKKIEESV